jgi:biotin transporter BioY
MESTTSRPAVDLASQRALAGPALALAVLSVPGSTLAWDLPGGGFVFGFPPAIAAVVLGALALRRSESRGMAVAAIVIAGAMLALMLVWMAVEALT